jgi:hypothetical protein
MKISVNDVELYTISETDLNILKNHIPSSLIEADIKRRLEWIYDEIYKTAFKELKDTWEPILAQRVTSIPTDRDAFAQLVFAQEDYKDRAARDLEAQQPVGE